MSLDTYSEHSPLNPANQKESEFTEAEMLQDEIERLTAKIKFMRSLVAEMNLIEQQPLFYISGLNKDDEKKYIEACEQLYYKIKFS